MSLLLFGFRWVRTLKYLKRILFTSRFVLVFGFVKHFTMIDRILGDYHCDTNQILTNHGVHSLLKAK